MCQVSFVAGRVRSRGRTHQPDQGERSGLHDLIRLIATWESSLEDGTHEDGSRFRFQDQSRSDDGCKLDCEPCAPCLGRPSRPSP